MAREFFKNLPNTTTPLTAPRLNALLDGDEPMGNIVVDSIRGKNLFNKDDVEVGFFSSNGAIQDNSNYRYSNYIDVSNINKITISGVTNTGTAHIIEYNSSHAFVDFWQSRNQTITLNANTKFIRVSLNINDINTYQVEKGETATNYAPYQNVNMEYAEGTWTPALDTLDGTPTTTYNSRSGTYIRIGNMAFISFVVKGKITALSGTNNYAIITGLPYWPKPGELGLNPLTQGEAYAIVSEWQSGVTYNVYRETVNGVAKPTIHIMNISGTGTLKYIVTTTTRFEIAGSGWYPIDTSS